MKNKKGFTLVELLAVIAILAILVVIAIPNIIEMYNIAKKDTFLTEVKTIFDETKKKYLSESMKNNKITNISSKDNSKLDITGEDLDYCIILDNDGKVEKIAVGNKSFYVMLSDVENINSITSEDIKYGQLQEMKCNPSEFKVKLNCEFDGKLTQGAEYVNGKYTYRYKQEAYYDSSKKNLAWKNISLDGWGVMLTDKESTEAVNSELCSSINDKPIVSMSHMFYNSKATIIDLIGFDTSKVESMQSMFKNTQTPQINGLNQLDTSNVTNMNGMFYGNKNTMLDLSNFNTSKVNNMGNMFYSSKATEIKGLEKFNTINVSSMAAMFAYADIEEIKGLENFNTSSVKNMSAMFQDSNVKTLDLSNFDTSSVEKMSNMFRSLDVETLDLSNFDTSNVTDMHQMFYESQVTTLDLSSFDTSKVTNMESMFELSKTTTGYARTQSDADKFNSSSNKPSGLTFVVK